MRINYFAVIVFLLISQLVSSQNDTITGVLLNNNNKAVKKHPVTLGKISPVTVKTDNKGFFTIPNANLNDTLYVGDKKGRNPIAIPMNGYPFITVKSQKGNFDREYLSEPDERLLRYLQQLEKDATKRDFGVLRQEDIKLLGCRDFVCLLRSMGGLSITDYGISLIGASNSSIRGSTNALIVLDGSVTELGIISSLIVEDIQDITVLKDGSKYGARGANGAIEIRTRRN